MYEVRQGLGKQISLRAREFALARMVDGSHPCCRTCMGINVTSGLWQQSRFSSYFNTYKKRDRKQGEGVGHAFEELCCLFLNARKNLVTF